MQLLFLLWGMKLEDWLKQEENETVSQSEYLNFVASMSETHQIFKFCAVKISFDKEEELERQFDAHIVYMYVNCPVYWWQFITIC